MSASEWKRPVREPRPAEKPSASILSVFYGYPDQLVASWCGVSVRTVARYRAGTLKPSRAVMRLFLLHRERQVLPPEWKGWKITPRTIVDPDGNETTRSQLHSFFLVMQFASHLARDHGPEAVREFYELLSG